MIPIVGADLCVGPYIDKLKKLLRFEDGIVKCSIGPTHRSAPTSGDMNSDREPRKRLRLEGFDYSQEGYYFLTVCTHNRETLFENPPVADMIEKYLSDASHKYPGVNLDRYVVMPNHVHAILQIVGADLCVGPGTTSEKIPLIMKWFKTQTTNAYLRGIRQYSWATISGKLWQRSYHDRIIRSEDELNVLRAYIRENPDKWEEDSENPFNAKKQWADT